jgi:hypothetical protein
MQSRALLVALMANVKSSDLGLGWGGGDDAITLIEAFSVAERLGLPMRKGTV